MLVLVSVLAVEREVSGDEIRTDPLMTDLGVSDLIGLWGFGLRSGSNDLGLIASPFSFRCFRHLYLKETR